MGLTRAMAAELRAKYAEMLVMRVEHATGQEDAARVRPRLNELASRFPGALREIDMLELGEIRRRIEQLDAVLCGRGAPEAWMPAVAGFHRLARGAFGAKRWLGGRKVVDAAVLAAFEREVPSLPFPEEIQSWQGDLATIALPPEGRVLKLVFARLAAELGVGESDARELVFGRTAPGGRARG